MRIALKLLIVLVVALAAVLSAWWYFAVPSNDRDWRADHAVLTHVNWQGTSTARVSNVRDWNFTGPDFPTERPYIERTIDTSRVSKMYFGYEPFGSSTSAAHTFFIFEFDDGESVAVSVEARRENDETLSIVSGVLPLYELIYVWSTERDIYTNIAVRLKGDLYRYELAVPRAQAGEVLRELLHQTAELSEKPKFYNVVVANCTNTLAKVANKIQPGSIPYHYSWIFSGYSDAYLYSLGFIKSEYSFDELKARSNISPLIRQGLLIMEKK